MHTSKPPVSLLPVLAQGIYCLQAGPGVLTRIFRTGVLTVKDC